MYENGKIYMGLAGGKRVELALNMCNRHGLIAGASGTGKTVTMKVMAESFSDAGVPVFLCDVKGDVAGICAPGQSSEGMEKRIDRFGLRGSFAYKGYPTTFWDIYQTGGHAVRAVGFFFGGGPPPPPGHRQRHGTGASQPDFGLDGGAGGNSAHCVSNCG